VAKPSWVILFAAAAALSEGCHAQTASIKKEVAIIKGKKVVVEYGSPLAKGHKIFGEVVPYGQVWEAGSATITTEIGLAFDKCRVPAGTYTLFPLPEALHKWSIILSKKTAKYNKAAELCRSSEPYGAGSSGKKEGWSDYRIAIISLNSQPDIGACILRLAWLDDEVDGFIIGQ
jgi:Protein of unknown function (DUF2911)